MNVRGLRPGRSVLASIRARIDRKHGSLPGWSGSAKPQQLEVDKWAASTTVLDLRKAVGDRPYPLDELLLMTAVFAYHSPEIVIDIGTHLGKSARIWHDLSKRMRTPTAIHTIDLLDPSHPEYPGDRHAEFIRGTPVKKHVGDGATIAERLIRASPASRCLLFLDGDHRQETVRRELELARLLAGGSAILVHDTFYQPSSGYNHGPYLAIQDFLESYAPQQIFHQHVGLPGMSYLGLTLA